MVWIASTSELNEHSISNLRDELRKKKQDFEILEHTEYDLFIIGEYSNSRVEEEDNIPAEIFEDENLFYNLFSSDPVVNARGKQLTEFMTGNGFILTNGRASSGRPL